MIRRAAPALAIALLGAPLLAQSSHNSDAPVDVEADRLEVQDNAHKAVFAGNVRVRQQEMTLTADRVVALYSGNIASSRPSGGGKAAPPKITRLDAAGNVVVTRPGEIAKGNYAIDDLNAKLITMIGNVSLDRNGSIVRGGRLVIDQNTNRATVDGSAVGAGSGKGGRVSGRFIVDSTPATPAATTPKK